MATYLILNVLFMVAVCVLLRMSPLKKPTRGLIITLIILLALTLIFDNLMIKLSLFSYEPSKILGAHIGLAPIEDFMYAILAVSIIPVLWTKFQGKSRGTTHDK